MNLDISLDLYKIFCVVVRTGNMSAAAKELYISQPAVSMSIRQLEDRIGSKLLVRTTKGVRTTPEGSVLYEYLEQALSLIKTAEEKYSEMVNMEKGEIKIGASDTIIANFLMPYIEKFCDLYANINIKVTNKTSFESLRLLKSGQVDLCFVNMPVAEDKDVEFTELMDIHDCLVGGQKFKELSQRGMELKEIGNYPLMLLEDSSNSRRFLNNYGRENGVVFEPVLELGSNDLLFEFAKINMGLTYVTREFYKDRIEKGEILEIPVNPPVPKRSIGLARLKNVALSHAAAGFVKLFDESL